MSNEKKAAYVVVSRDYEGISPVAVFGDEDTAEAYVRQLSKRVDASDYEVDKVPFVAEVPTEYELWRGYAFKYLTVEALPYTHEPTFYVRSETSDDLHAEPRPIVRDQLFKAESSKGIPFYALEVEGASEEAVRRRYAERVAEGEAWLEGLVS